jgi:hypothetical protein
MLDFPSIRSTGQEGVRLIFGDRLAQLLPKINKSFRALLGYELVTGTAQLYRPTREQVAATVQVSRRYIDCVAAMTPEQREQVSRKRLTLSTVINHKRVPIDVGTIAAVVEKFGVDNVVAHIGGGVVLAALDRMTAPATTTNNNKDTDIADWWRQINAPATPEAAE